MAKTLSLGIVIGASVGAAIKSLNSVTNSTKLLTTTIDKLNSKKISILDGIDKKFSAKLNEVNTKLQNFYNKQRDIKLKISVVDKEIKDFNKKLKETDKEIKKLEKEKIDLEKDFLKGKISAEEFNKKTKEIESTLNSLNKKKLSLDEKIKKAEFKSKSLNNSLKSVNNTINKLKDKKLRLDEELKKAKDEAIKANKELKKIGDTIEKLNKIKVKIQANIDKRDEFKSKALDTIAMGASVALPFKAGIEFESAMARVKALSGATKEEFKKLEETARKLGSTTTFSASEAAEGMQFLAMAGFKTNEIVKAMPGLLDLAAAGQTDLATTADITSNILSGFRISADKTTHVADVLAKATTTANVDVRMLGETMKYVAPAASGLGASLEEVTALAAKLGDVGIQGSEAGTALRSMYARLASPPSEAKKVITQLGVQIKDANGNFVGMFNVLEQLQQKTKYLSNTQKATILKNLFGMEAMSAGAAILKLPIEKLREYEKTLINADGTAKKIAKTQNDTVAGSFKALGSAVEGLSISFSYLFLPAIKKITEGITWLTQKINSFINEHKTLATMVGGAIAGFGALTVATFVLGYAATFIANAWHKGAMVVNLLRSAMLLYKSGTITTTIATKTQAFWEGVLATKRKITTIWTNRATIANKAYTLSSTVLGGTLKLLGGAFRFVGSGILWIGRALMANPIGLIIGIIAGGAYLIYSNWDKLNGWFASLWDGIKNIFSFAWRGIKEIFTTAWDGIKEVLSYTPIGIIINNWDKIRAYFSAFWNNLIQGFNKGVNFIANIFVSPIQIIKKYWSKMLGWISDKIKWIKDIGGEIAGFFGFDGDDKDKEDKEKDKKSIKKIAVATTIAAAQSTITPQITPVINPIVNTPTINPVIDTPTITSKVAIKPIQTQSIQTSTNYNQASQQQKTIIYNFNFGDIKIEAKDGKTPNLEELKDKIKQVIEEIDFENKQRSISDVV